MKARTQGFKDNIKTIGRELDVKVSYDNEVLDSEAINTFKPHFNTEFFKTIMKTFEFDSNVKVPAKTWVTPEFGIKVDGEYEYLDYGRYYINDEPEYSADNRAYTHKTYDAMIEAMIPFDENPLYIEYPISYDDLITNIINQLGWTYDLPADYPNKDTMIEYDLYSNLGLTYRDILDDLCPATMGNFIVSDDKKLKIIYPNETGDIIDEEYLKDANVNVSKKVGPVNALVLSRAEGDTINRTDEDSIELNGLNEIKIKDNLLLSSAFRESFIDEMFERIKGFEYYSIDVASTGIGYFDPLDRFTLSIYGESYSVVLLNSELNVESGVSENLFTPELEEAVTDYSTSGLSDKGKKMANIIAYKNEAKIEMITEEVNEATEKITIFEQTVDGFDSTISKVDELAEEITEIKANTQEVLFNFKEKTKNPNLMYNSSGFFGLQGVNNPFQKTLVKMVGNDLPNANNLNSKYLLRDRVPSIEIYMLYERILSINGRDYEWCYAYNVNKNTGIIEEGGLG